MLMQFRKIICKKIKLVFTERRIKVKVWIDTKSSLDRYV